LGFVFSDHQPVELNHLAPRDSRLPVSGKPDNLLDMNLMNRMTQALAASLAATSLWRVMLILIAGAVAYLALSPAPPVLIDTGWDKANHTLAFASMAFTAFLSCRSSNAKRAFLMFVLFGYGGLIEILQASVPNRTADWADLLADTVGIAAGAAVAAFVLFAFSAALRNKR
jgi:VanZ family protein